MPSASEPDEMPPVTPEGVTLRIAITAFLNTVGPKKADAFLKEMARLYSDEDAMQNILSFRPPAQAGSVQKARRQSLAWFRAVLPALMSRRR